MVCNVLDSLLQWAFSCSRFGRTEGSTAG